MLHYDDVATSSYSSCSESTYNINNSVLVFLEINKTYGKYLCVGLLGNLPHTDALIY